jgi:signal transduction histidine kinase
MLATVNVGDGAAMVLAGTLIAHNSSWRRCGLLLGCAGYCWSLQWMMSWNSSALPIAGSFFQAIFWFLFVCIVLVYPDGSLRDLLDVVFIVVVFVITVGGQVFLTLTSHPEWNGFSPDSFWVNPLPVERETFSGFLRSAARSYVGFSACLLVLAVRRLVYVVRGVDRMMYTPVLLAAVLAESTAVITFGDLMAEPRFDPMLRGFAWQGVALVTAPVALLATALYRRLVIMTTAHRLLRLTRPPTVRRVRDALRIILRDPTLETYFWVSGEGCYVDIDGRPIAIGGSGPDTSGGTPDRWRLPVRSQSGTDLAVVECDGTLRRHRTLVNGALTAGSLTLQNAQLQSSLQAQIARVAEAHRRVVAAEADERRRIERDLQDTVQQRLLVLEMLAASVQEVTADPVAAAVLLEIGNGLRMTVSEIRDVARGLHPAVLDHNGLRHAVEDLIARLRIDADVCILPERLAPATERLAYYALAEALTNVRKHADATKVTVRIQTSGRWLVAEVVDDGCGGARCRPGGGLASIAHRLDALGGSLDLTSVPEVGTHLTVKVPCVEV